MWEVWEHGTMKRQLGGLSPAVRKRYEFWKDVAAMSGQDGLRAVRGFRDTRLRDDWAGWRSSRITDSHRVIYRYLYRKFWPMFILKL